MALYYSDEQITLHHGDSLAVLQQLPDASVDCCVTSPPYFGLRDYGEEGQYGLEASPAEYVETMRAVFTEVRRVLADDGTLWLNIGDSYASTTKGTGGNGSRSSLGVRANGEATMTPEGVRRGVDRSHFNPRKFAMHVPAKNLLGIPWRTAFALQDDGWILRNDIIWAKPNAMPMSVQDRLNTVHEHVFLFAKARRYWFDLDPIRSEPRITEAEIAAKRRQKVPPNPLVGEATDATRASRSRPITQVLGSFDEVKGANPGDVWTVPTQPFAAAHFAVMPQALAERAILAGCKPGGTVLDPFSGSGTTGLAATKHGRKYVGIDLSADYLDLSLKTRFAEQGFNFGEVTA